ncbi:MAG: hypothetical protein PHV17_06435 [Candidatus Omnitrophica bacterium]|nr:hypothetical protein [Candidatus Omnitrophota bacterium]
MVSNKRLVGVIIVAILFILIGLIQFYNLFDVYSTEQKLPDFVYQASIQKLVELDVHIRSQAARFNPEKRESIYKQIFQLKRIVNNYKINFVDNRRVSLPLLFFIFSSVFSGMMFVITGVNLLRLKVEGLNYLFFSLATGLATSLLLLWVSSTGIGFIWALTDRVINVIRTMNDGSLLPIRKTANVYFSIFSSQFGYFISLFFGCYALFSLIVFSYFKQAKVREKFVK